MKKFVSFFIFCMIMTSLFAQEQAKYDYCEIVGTPKPLSTKVTVQIDFGQATKLVLFLEDRYKDESGNPIVFNSMIDAMNYMGKQGWEFVQAYAVTYNDNAHVYHYVLKKVQMETTDTTK